MATLLFPNEFEPDLLRLGERRVHNQRGDWSSQMTYNDTTVQIQTPWLRNVFGTSMYQNSNTKPSYSLSFELSEEPEVVEFREFLETLDKWFQEKFKECELTGTYFSSIRQSNKDQYPPTLRTKLKTKGRNFDVMYMENNDAKTWAVNHPDGSVVEMVKHGDKCKAILELMPVWSAGGRIGTSWKVVTLMRQVAPNFRSG